MRQSRRRPEGVPWVLMPCVGHHITLERSKVPGKAYRLHYGHQGQKEAATFKGPAASEDLFQATH